MQARSGIAARRRCEDTRVATKIAVDWPENYNRNCRSVSLLLPTFEKRNGMKLRLHTEKPLETNRVIQCDFWLTIRYGRNPKLVSYWGDLS